MGQLLREGEGVPDFVLLDTLSEQAVFENMLTRYKKDQIYTYIGPVIVAVNPFKKIDKLYTDECIKSYKGREVYEVQPHIFALADNAYRNLLKSAHNQVPTTTTLKTKEKKLVLTRVSSSASSSVANQEQAR
jgi:myosin-1